MLLVGAKGYIGRFVPGELVAQGFRVICLMRDGAALGDAELPGSDTHIVDVCDSTAMSTLNLVDEPLAEAISCLASHSPALIAA